MRFTFDEQRLARARKMVAAGVSMREIDRYFRCGMGSTQKALLAADNPEYREARRVANQERRIAAPQTR